MWLLCVIFLTALRAALVRRVVQGNGIGRRPFMVHLRHSSSFFCGGVIFSESSVITAAHCNKFLIEEWSAHLNRLNIDLEAEKDKAFYASIARRVDHPLYNSTTFSFDVSVWKINAKIHNYPLIVFTIKPELFNYVYAIGWGETRPIKHALNYRRKMKYSPILKRVKMPIYNPWYCMSRYPHFNPYIMLCTGDPLSKSGVCFGDSGGPLYQVFNNTILLLGLISHSWGCANDNHVIGTGLFNLNIIRFVQTQSYINENFY